MSDNFIWVTTSAAFAAVGTWNDARVAACDIAMTAAGDAHFGTFPAAAKGDYFVQVRVQAGGSVDTDDREVAQGVMYWDGSGEISWSSEQGIKWLKNG